MSAATREAALRRTCQIAECFAGITMMAPAETTALVQEVMRRGHMRFVDIRVDTFEGQTCLQVQLRRRDAAGKFVPLSRAVTLEARRMREMMKAGGVSA